MTNISMYVATHAVFPSSARKSDMFIGVGGAVPETHLFVTPGIAGVGSRVTPRSVRRSRMSFIPREERADGSAAWMAAERYSRLGGMGECGRRPRSRMLVASWTWMKGGKDRMEETVVGERGMLMEVASMSDMGMVEDIFGVGVGWGLEGVV